MMRGLIRLFVVFPTVVASFSAGVLPLWPIGEAEPTTFPAGDVERGAYLARESGCVSCHTDAKNEGLALAGGAPLDTPFGTFVPPNITPHPDAGIGQWTIQDFARAVRQGVSPEGAPYYPVFTYSFYAGFSDQDIADMWEAFRSVPPVAKAAPAHDVGFPFSFRSGLKLWRAAYLVAPETAALMGTSSPWNRGRLLVEGAAHCAACHTGRTLAGGLDDDARFAGNDRLPGGSKAPSILTEDLLGRGWTVANLSYALKSGLLPNGDAFGGSMAEVVAEGTLYLTDTDREAIATYLLDLEGTGEILAPTPPATDTPMAGMDHSQMDMTNEN
jgi:mono/diheme cytochrome c family protein